MADYAAGFVPGAVYGELSNENIAPEGYITGGTVTTVRNRVYDSEKPGFHFWETPWPDPTGILYDGPGEFGVDTSDFTVVGRRVE